MSTNQLDDDVRTFSQSSSSRKSDNSDKEETDNPPRPTAATTTTTREGASLLRVVNHYPDDLIIGRQEEFMGFSETELNLNDEKSEVRSIQHDNIV